MLNEPSRLKTPIPPAAVTAEEAVRTRPGDIHEDEAPATSATPSLPTEGGEDQGTDAGAWQGCGDWQAEAAGWVNNVSKKRPPAMAPAERRARDARWRLLDKSLCGGFVVLSSLLLIGLMAIFNRDGNPDKVMFTDDTLALYNGKNGSPLYLALLGHVFDVSRKPEFYGEGATYHHFVGTDATRAFVTGAKSGSELNSDTQGLTDQQCASLLQWLNFYHKDYIWKGRLIGRFFNNTGHRQRALDRVEAAAGRAATTEEQRKAAEAVHPRCSAKWNEAEGGVVYCSDGLRPRKVFDQQADGKPQTRCACFKELGWSDARQVYPGCKPEASQCRTTPPAKAPPHAEL